MTLPSDDNSQHDTEPASRAAETLNVRPIYSDMFSEKSSRRLKSDPRTGTPRQIPPAEISEMKKFKTRDELIDMLNAIPASTDGDGHMVTPHDKLLDALNDPTFFESQKILIVKTANKLPGLKLSLKRSIAKLTGLQLFEEILKREDLDVKLRYYHRVY
jgi:hypothetical protein